MVPILAVPELDQDSPVEVYPLLQGGLLLSGHPAIVAGLMPAPVANREGRLRLFIWLPADTPISASRSWDQLDKSSPAEDSARALLEVRQTETVATWFGALGDRRAKARIQVRIDGLALGNPGDVKPVGEGVSELRIDHGPGYRVYFVRRGEKLVVLLAGGEKQTQGRDIKSALELARSLKRVP